MTANLDGITVLDLSSVGPGARCTALLADLGADVVKVRRPAGGGGIEPPWFAYGAGRGTRSVELDLKSEHGREHFLDLAAVADVVVESFRPGVADRLGIGYKAVTDVNPRIVYAALTGYGQDGPYAQWAGHDLDYLAVGGFLATQGRRADGAPAIPGATVADSAGGGMHAVIAILAALLSREKTDEGQYLDVAATDGVLSLMSLQIDEFLATGAAPAADTTLLTGKYACYDVYRTRDDRHVAVGAIEPHFFANLCALLELEDLAPLQYEDARQDEVRAALAQRFATRDRDEWVTMLAGADTCVAPVLSIAEVTADAHLRERGTFVRFTHPEHGTVEQVAPVIAGARRTPRRYG